MAFGPPPGTSPAENPPLLVIDVLALPPHALAAVVAWAPVRPRGNGVPGSLPRSAVRGTAAPLVVHAAPSVVDWATRLATSATGGGLDGADLSAR
ncbi:hypothetical protein ACL03H_17220 [Saccharopolyspora sp. MS10]|uniref:hypothetical protein n=1 Tax=Saccharopolyspora sp. MS10 TaxID=3385973 RepID=UPI0039A1B24E